MGAEALYPGCGGKPRIFLSYCICGMGPVTSCSQVDGGLVVAPVSSPLCLLSPTPGSGPSFPGPEVKPHLLSSGVSVSNWELLSAELVEGLGRQSQGGGFFLTL